MTRKVRTPGELKTLEAREGPGAMLAACVGGAQARRVMTAVAMGANAMRVCLSSTRRERLLGRENPWRAEPQERQRGETNPQGARRSKPTRGCETSRSERTG
jgi:hypothetical protein